jgi:transposase-like protein
VVYKSITVIGLGTLGGFVANALANLETLETLILIDHDTVESKNLKNSIYRQIDVGLSKTEALIDIISKKNSELTVMAMEEKYIEGKTKIPLCDLVLDCRDYTYDRTSEIDVRLYISSRYLMVDCRKKVNYKEKSEGRYLLELNKQDLRYAGGLVSMLISNNTIKSLLKNKKIQKYELDYVKHIDSESYDIVYETGDSDEKFVNLPDHIVPILKANKEYDLDVCVGSSLFPIAEYSIPKQSLQSSTDLIVNLSKAVSNLCEFNNFVIALHHAHGKYLVELIPETGAA